MQPLRAPSWFRTAPLGAALVGALFLFGCGEQGETPTSPDGELSTSRAAPVQEAAPGELVPDRYIVLLKDGTREAPAAAEAVASAHGLDLRHVYGTAVRGFSAVVPEGRLQSLRRDDAVQTVEQVRKVRLDAQELPTGIDRVETDRNPSADIDGSDDIRVDLDIAIIDSGVDTDHPDLNVAGGRNFANGPAGKFDDGNGHGTHVSGTVGAIDNGTGVVGVAPGAPIWGVRVCGNSGFCFTDDMVAGIDWVADQKSSGTVDFAAANMSISTSDDATECTSSSGAVHRAICGLVETGVVFSLAAGNDGREKDAFPEVMAVSALADFDGRGGGFGSPTCRNDQDETLADFSNWGSEVDVAAPGVCILSTWNDGGTATISGTSMAAPHAAGAVALYLHANGLSPATDGAGVDGIEQAILDAALPQGDACGYTNEHAGDGSTEPLLFVNGSAFGGDGTCDDGSDGGGETNSAPTASFTHACTDLSCDFDGSGSSDSDGSITSYDWDFGDETTGTGETVSHTYDAGGDYTVTLTVTDDDGATDTESQVVSVSSSEDGGESASGMHVGDLDGSSVNNGRTWDAVVTVTVHDANGDPVDGAEVKGTWTGTEGGSADSTTCTTDSTGQCTVSATGMRKNNGTVTYTVDDVTHSSLSYTSSDNHDPDGDSDGTSITVSK